MGMCRTAGEGTVTTNILSAQTSMVVVGSLVLLCNVSELCGQIW